MITRQECMVTVVTKGDRDLSEVMKSLKGFGYVYVWNNSEPLTLKYFGDKKVYGRYVAMAGASLVSDIYWTLPYIRCCQDDDVIVDWDELLKHYDPEKIVCNMPQPWRPHYLSTGGISLVGFGAVMHQSIVDGNGAARPFQAYFDAGFTADEVFLRECDRVFTYLNRHRTLWVDVPIQRLDYGAGPDRMYRQERQVADYAEIRRRLAVIGERA